MTYLSELFLQLIDEDFSSDSLTRAVEGCNQEYESRKGSVDVDEFRAFWDVFVDSLSDYKGEPLPLLTAARQVAVETHMRLG